MMRTYVRLENNIVVELLDAEDDFDITNYPAFLIWVETTAVSPKPTYGWTYDGVSFTEPPPPYVDPRPPILYELEQIDKASSRPLRTLIIADADIGAGTPERAELETLEARATILRAQLAALDE